jgi:hypothetical protein
MASAPTLGAVPWKAPGCQEAHDACERTLLHWLTRAMPAFGGVSCLHVHAQVQTTRACPTHVWRFCPRAAATAQGSWASGAPEPPLSARVPSASKRGLSGSRSPVSPRCGGGAAHGCQAPPASGCEEPARASTPRAGLREARPLCCDACDAAASQGGQHVLARLSPGAAREATGSPAPLRDAVQHVSLSKTLARVHRSDTARAR